MSNIDSDTLDWAARCYADGRPLEFIASVLEVKENLRSS